MALVIFLAAHSLIRMATMLVVSGNKTNLKEGDNKKQLFALAINVKMWYKCKVKGRR